MVANHSVLTQNGATGGDTGGGAAGGGARITGTYGQTGTTVSGNGVVPGAGGVASHPDLFLTVVPQ